MWWALRQDNCCFSNLYFHRHANNHDIPFVLTDRFIRKLFIYLTELDYKLKYTKTNNKDKRI